MLNRQSLSKNNKNKNQISSNDKHKNKPSIANSIKKFIQSVGHHLHLGKKNKSDVDSSTLADIETEKKNKQLDKKAEQLTIITNKPGGIKREKDNGKLVSKSLLDLPEKLIYQIANVDDHNNPETLKTIAALSRTCKRYHGFFNPILSNPTFDLRKALYHAAHAEEKNIKTLVEMINVNPSLLLERGNVITPAGLDVRNVTIYEFLLGSGEPYIAKQIKPFFAKIKDGEEEEFFQYERYRPHIESMLEQKPDKLIWLFNIIDKSSPEDVAAELARGDDYDKNYQSPLRDALNLFRKQKLNPKSRIITEPRMHCNYQNFTNACHLLAQMWNKLVEQDESSYLIGEAGCNYDKHYLIAQQIIGFIELTEFPSYERCFMARDKYNEATKGMPFERSFFLKHVYSRFPVFTNDRLVKQEGVGFDSFISTNGDVLSVWMKGLYMPGLNVSILDETCQRKLHDLQKLNPCLLNRKTFALK